MAKLAYKRVLLKLSGEALMGQGSYGIDTDVLAQVAEDIKDVESTGVQIAVVIGGGNIFRGVAPSAKGMDRANADYMGMLATVMNALALADACRGVGLKSQVMSGLEVVSVVEPYVRSRAIKYLENGNIVFFAAGTGNPFFTTDTAASLRALEVGAELVLKATKVDGVFDKDPVKNEDAVRYEKLSYDEVLEKRLAVMDATAVALCRENDLPLRVLNINRRGSMKKVVLGEKEGTLISSGAD